MSSFYFKTFARVALLPYIGGTVIHILRLIYNFPIAEIPFEVDWLVVIIGGYAGIGLIIYANFSINRPDSQAVTSPSAGDSVAMLTEIYIEALLVDEELAEQVWEAWDAGEIDACLPGQRG